MRLRRAKRFCDALAKRVGAEPATRIQVDLAACEVGAGDARFPLSIPPPTRRALLEGAWDPIAELLAHGAAIRATVDRLEYLRWTGETYPTRSSNPLACSDTRTPAGTLDYSTGARSQGKIVCETMATFVKAA